MFEVQAAQPELHAHANALRQQATDPCSW
jgi:hypothetical protein